MKTISIINAIIIITRFVHWWSLEKLHSLRKQVFFVENDVVLKSILDEREACVALPNITVLKTRIEQLFGGTNSSKS